MPESTQLLIISCSVQLLKSTEKVHMCRLSLTKCSSNTNNTIYHIPYTCT